jgi:hypothetical protein
LVASYVAVRFGHHLRGCEFPEVGLASKIAKGPCAYFDARVMAFPSEIEVVNHLVWRCNFDGVRNSISALARHHLGHQACFGKKRSELKQMLRDLPAALPWEDLEAGFKYGVFLKKELYVLVTSDRKTGEPIAAQRSRPWQKSLLFDAVRDVGLVLGKYAPP